MSNEIPDDHTCRRVARIIADKDPGLAHRFVADRLHIDDLALIERHASAVVKMPPPGWSDTDGSATRFWTALAHGVAAALANPTVAWYRTRPVEILAIQCTNENLKEIKTFAGDALVLGDDRPRLRTAQGSLPYVQLGDWIAKDEHGFRHLLNRDITMWFEEVSEQEPPTS